MDGVYPGQSSYSTEKGVNSYFLRVIRGCILHDDANI